MAQTRKESMQEAAKLAEQGSEAAYRLQEENSVLQARLADLGSVARKAIHEEYYTTESLIESLETENKSLREMLGVAEGGNGPVRGRLDHWIRENGLLQDEDYDESGLRDRGSRVSFPSTAGSMVASSESDREQQQQSQRQQPQHSYPLSTRRSASDSGVGIGIRVGRQPLSPINTTHNNNITTPRLLTVQTGTRSPTTTASTPVSPSSPVISTSSRSVSGVSSTTSPTSPSWSTSTSASSSALASPISQLDPSRRMVSISPPLDPADELPVDLPQQHGVMSRASTGSSIPKPATGAGQPKGNRGKMTINTKLGAHAAARSL
ncbi:hypothetical protein FBU30_009246 [Linnemannia zychae]|nr:hypothetical protein FBU30_009246 [Linnemannia zychae]